MLSAHLTLRPLLQIQGPFQCSTVASAVACVFSVYTGVVRVVVALPLIFSSPTLCVWVSPSWLVPICGANVSWGRRGTPLWFVQTQHSEQLWCRRWAEWRVSVLETSTNSLHLIIQCVWVMWHRGCHRCLDCGVSHDWRFLPHLLQLDRI